MSNELLRIILPVYFFLYFFVLLFLKTILIKKLIGKNPIVLTGDDTAYSLLGFYFKATIASLAVYVILFCTLPGYYDYFLPIKLLELESLKWAALILSAIFFVWTVIAQNAMRKSWRVGIDLNTKTELVTTGVFRFSRNPVYVGMIGSIASLFLATPNAVTLLISVVGYILIQVQIRLEEEYLAKMHGQSYLDYKQKVRRFL